MKYLLLSILHSILFFGNNQKNKTGDKPANENFDCPNGGTMKRAWYESSVMEDAPPIKSLPNEFIVLVDTAIKAANFISSEEEFLREKANTADTSILNYLNFGKELTTNEKLEEVRNRKILYIQDADAEHVKNNTGKIKVWVIRVC